MQLSVVVVSHETRELLLDGLVALQQELAHCAVEHELLAEVVVVDNGSSDGTVEAVRTSFPDARLVALPENLGFAAGANAGIRSTKGRVVLLLNSDAQLQRGCLATCLRAFEERPDAGVVGAQLLHPDDRLQNSIHAFPSLVSELLPTWLLEGALPRRFPSSKRWRATRPQEVEAVRGAALFVRREVIEAVGLLPEDYFFFLEETDWCWRIRRAGWRVLHVPDARVVHLSGASSKQRDPARTRIEYQTSLTHFLRVNRSPATARAVVAIRFVKSLVGVLGLSLAALPLPRYRPRLKQRARVLHWQLRGCPPGWGLAPESWVATRRPDPPEQPASRSDHRTSPRCDA